MNYKFIALFVLGLVILIAFQAKIVMPFVYDIVSSDLFMEDTGDEKNRVSATNSYTRAAYSQCNANLEKLLPSDSSATFTNDPINAFGLGNYQYVINADAEILPADGTPFTRRYVCRIKYLSGSDTTVISDPENWSIEGFSGLENL